MISAAARTQTYQTVRRVRTVSIIRRTVRCLDGVPGTAACLDQLDREAVVDLAAEALNVDLDQVRHRVEAVVPNVLGNIRPADDLALASDQVLQQCVFLRRQLNRAVRTLYSAGTGVNGQVFHRQD